MEPISLFLDSFIQLAQRIINLEKTKREDKQQVFREIIEPLFVQLQPIAENYIAIFRDARQSLVSMPDSELPRVLNEMRAAREKMELARITVRTMARQIQGMYKDSDTGKFAANILLFFEASVDGQTALSTKSEELIEMIEKVAAQHSEKDELFNYIKGTQSLLQRFWKDINSSYAAIKITSLSAPDLIKKKK